MIYIDLFILKCGAKLLFLEPNCFPVLLGQKDIGTRDVCFGGDLIMDFTNMACPGREKLTNRILVTDKQRKP